MLYSELQCSEAIHKAVERMGFAEMTEVQEKTIPVMLAGRDVIAKAPTGTGKTCAFGIPVAEHIDPALKAPQAVILAPTRELAQQIAEELKKTPPKKVVLPKKPAPSKADVAKKHAKANRNAGKQRKRK